MAQNFQGFIKDVRYQAFLAEDLSPFSFHQFDINEVSASGKIVHPNGELAFSKWVSPKRTRSYPFERLYNTFNSPMRLTVIPIIKDEGADGDLDKIQYSTISWMNLLNIYIVLGYYDQAQKNNRPQKKTKNKINQQKFNCREVNEQIAKISTYKQSALHWNRTLIEERFVKIYRSALDSYEKIGQETGTVMHHRSTQEQYLSKILNDFEEFKNISLRGSKGASLREIQTFHEMEYLSEGFKATFQIENYLGGVYFLTADEVLKDKDIYTIQESKNSTSGFLPGLSDIKDGLFKLILFSNLDSLLLDGKNVLFQSCLKLTGKKIYGSVAMPCNGNTIEKFLKINVGNYSKKEAEILRKLNLEAANNQKLIIRVSSNTP